MFKSSLSHTYVRDVGKREEDASKKKRTAKQFFRQVPVAQEKGKGWHNYAKIYDKNAVRHVEDDVASYASINWLNTKMPF